MGAYAKSVLIEAAATIISAILSQGNWMVIPQAKSVEAVVAAWPNRLSQPVNQPKTATWRFGARY